MNILQIEDIIKGLPDARLYEEALTPSGQLPQFLLVSEVQRRMDMRKRFANTEPQPVGSVYDKIMREASMQVPQEQQQPQMQPQMQQMAGGGIVQLQAGGVTPYGSDHFQIVVNGEIIDIPMGNYASQDDAIEAYALQHGRADINPANEGFDPTWGQSEPDGIAALDVPLLDVPRETPKTAVHPDKVDAYTDAEGPMAQASLAQKLLTPGGIVGLDDESNEFITYLKQTANQATEIPDFSDMAAEARKDAYNAALIQLAAGISSGNMSTAISKAGEAAMEGKKAAREIEQQSKLTRYGIQQQDRATKVGIYSDLVKLNATVKRISNAGDTVHSKFVDDNDNVNLITRGGQIVNTGIKEKETAQVIIQPDGSVSLIDRAGADAGGKKDVIPSEEGLEKKKAGAKATEEGTQVAKAEGIAPIKEEERQQVFLDDAIRTSDAMPTVKRALQLLESVETGGVEGAKLRAKRWFGVEAADEGELASGLTAAVLARLRETFGSQFTEKEGQLLIRASANPNASTETNIRLLKQQLKLWDRKIKRGRSIAEKNEDLMSLGIFDENDQFSLDEDELPNTPVEQERMIRNPATGEVRVWRNGQWVTVNE